MDIFYIAGPDYQIFDPETVDLAAEAKAQLGADIVCRHREYHRPYKPALGNWPFHLISAKNWPEYCLDCGVLLGAEPEPDRMYLYAEGVVSSRVPVTPKMKKTLDEYLERGRRWFKYGR